MDLQRVGRERFGGQLQRGIDFADQDSWTAGAPRFQLFEDRIAAGWNFREENRCEVSDHFVARSHAESTTAAGQVKLFASFKKFVGGAELSSSAKYDAVRELDSRCISMRQQVLVAELTADLPTLLASLKPEVRQRIEAIESAHDRRASTTSTFEMMVDFLKDHGTHYVQSLCAGGQLSLSLYHESVQETDCQTKHQEAKAGIAKLFNLEGQRGTERTATRASWSQDLQVSVAGGPSGLGLAPQEATTWLQGVTSSNATLLEVRLRPVSELFRGEVAKVVEQRIEYLIFQSRYRHTFDALQQVMRCSLQGLRRLLDQERLPLQEVLKSMNCSGCDSCKTGAELIGSLVPLRQQLHQLEQVTFTVEDMARLLTPQGTFAGPLETLEGLILNVRKALSNARFLKNKGALKGGRACDHMTWGPSRKEEAVSQAGSILKRLRDLMDKVRGHVVTTPPWFKPHFQGRKNRMIVGPTNVGKGSLGKEALDHVNGKAPVGSDHRPVIEERETLGEVRSFQLGEEIWLHDIHGCGTTNHPLDAAYFALLGLHKMDRVALSSLANSPETCGIIKPLLTALTNHNVPHCLVLTKADAVYQPDEDEEVTLARKVADWRRMVPTQNIFVISTRPAFRQQRWNQLDAFLQWFTDP